MSTIPDDISLYNIIPLLPSKTLIRFICTCKRWNTFIRQPSFLNLRKLTHNIIFLSPLGSSKPHIFSSPCHFDPHDNDVILTPPRASSLLVSFPNLSFPKTRVQCVNGLLCVHPRGSVWLSSHVEAFTFIVNPTTRQVHPLPLDHSVERREFMVSTHFGYDNVRGEFKVLRVFKYRARGSHDIKIFTLGCDASWRRVSPGASRELVESLLTRHWDKRGVCMNGVIYWTHGFILLLFDVGPEEILATCAPPRSGYSLVSCKYPSLQYPDLIEMGGSLCLFRFRGNDLKLWFLKDHESAEWESKSVVLPPEVVPPEEVVFPLCRIQSGEILFLPYFVPTHVRGVLYDMERRTFRTLALMEMPHSLLPDPVSGQLDMFYCQQSFMLLE
ncbi:putative F-box protein At1g47730 [Cajanus cajan]|uniref:F-box protein At1g47730 family n=1 Tax=Cajanus cajan TaxID=3821 RepID=A0A151SZR7_CAJCA|nr:putative F-box protein At1g47730 [Cajanus cajan]KYP60283.1 Putative F-box protein At1g47730 family [Cajanus cajan]